MLDKKKLEELKGLSEEELNKVLGGYDKRGSGEGVTECPNCGSKYIFSFACEEGYWCISCGHHWN